MSNKFYSPYPYALRVILKKILPYEIYRRYVGRHEDGSLDLWQQLAQKVPPKEAILDIGAYKGIYALKARKVNQEAPVFAFEPNPFVIQELKSSCLSKRIEVINTAVGEQNGTAKFICANAGSRIIKSAIIQSEKIITVPIVSLDRWCENHSIIPSLIKIDTEGAEASILRGSKKMLNNNSPIILCEVLSDSAGIEVMRALPPNYAFYAIDENTKSLRKKTRISRLNWRNKNWLLIPKGKLFLSPASG